ncbi:type IV secretory system conjugative DNA transfer family protein [Streptomyces chartreusis]|uniref:Type IV secretory system conjugative DNA transfer family protein n=1 Tax=Streptomyces chartreusis TaxID=1969 RepID=A0A7H8TBK7_STRCX|nr:type IV secretory system conjugative DNA transfer family protein [Streptomyces chartreusis]QKZ20378.1 type IV secretory system conjugative DNA transfer family protein [Streptomyces chartreusis]
MAKKDSSLDDGTFLAAAAVGALVSVSTILLVSAQLAGLLSGKGWPSPTRSLPETTVWSVVSGPGAAYEPAPPAWLFWTFVVLLSGLVVTAVVFLVVRFGGRTDTGGAKWGGKKTEKAMAAPAHPEERPGRITAGRGQNTGGILAVSERAASGVAFGPPGSAKTTGLLLGNAAEWSGPAVITTTKAADLKAIYASRRILGPVYVIAPAGLPGMETHHYSPVDYATDPESAERMAEWMAEAAQKTYDPRAEPWIAQARAILAGLLLASNVSGGGISRFREWLALGRDAVDHVRSILEPRYPEVAIDYAQPWLQLHKDGAGSVQFTLNVIAAVYRSQQIRDVAASTDFTAEEILDNNGTIIMVAAPTNADRFGPLFTAIIASVIHAAENRFEQTGEPLKNVLGLFIDEAGNVLRYPKLPTILTTGRGMGVALLTIWHDISQLASRVGSEGAKTVISASHLRMLLPGLADDDTIRYFNYLLGKEHAERTTRSSGSTGRSSTSTAVVETDLVPVHELREIPHFTAIAVYFNQRPLRVNMRLTWRDEDLIAWLNRPAQRVSLNKGLDLDAMEASLG